MFNSWQIVVVIWVCCSLSFALGCMFGAAARHNEIPPGTGHPAA